MPEVVIKIFYISSYVIVCIRSRNIGTYSISVSQCCFSRIPVSITFITVTCCSRQFCDGNLDTYVNSISCSTCYRFVLAIKCQGAIFVILDELVSLFSCSSPSQDVIRWARFSISYLLNYTISIVHSKFISSCYLNEATLTVCYISFVFYKCITLCEFFLGHTQFFKNLTGHVFPSDGYSLVTTQVRQLRSALVNNNCIRSSGFFSNFQLDVTC